MGLKNNILDVENDLPSVGVDFLKYLLSIRATQSLLIKLSYFLRKWMVRCSVLGLVLELGYSMDCSLSCHKGI